MGAIGDLCWTSAEELFRDIDLDDLYARQVQAIRADRCSHYPYLLLVFTGKITIGIAMASAMEPLCQHSLYDGSDGGPEREDSFFPWNP